MSYYVAFSDTHGKHRALPFTPCEVVIFAGDAENYGEGLEDFLSWYSEYPAQHRLFVPGNHDMEFERRWNADPKAVRSQYPGITFLVNFDVVIDGIRYFGSPYTRKYPLANADAYNEPHAYGQGENPYAGFTLPDVLITHSPPYGTHDQWRTPNGDMISIGSEYLRDWIGDVKLPVHIFGHVHNLSGEMRRETIPLWNHDCTRVEKLVPGPARYNVNVSAVGWDYEIRETYEVLQFGKYEVFMSAIEAIVREILPEAVDPEFTRVFTDNTQDYCIFYDVDEEVDLLVFMQMYPMGLDFIFDEKDDGALTVPEGALAKAMVYMEAARRYFFRDKYHPTQSSYTASDIQSNGVLEFEGPEIYLEFDFELAVPNGELETYLSQFTFGNFEDGSDLDDEDGDCP